MNYYKKWHPGDPMVPQMLQMVVPESSRGQEGPDEAPGGVLKRKVSYVLTRMQKFH